ncbi:putative pentatricopeptide repeat-containing protein-like [Capsicum annuum]|nr:putative pentatricopeptide repeat-containing protein-like [Capsicum annuum]KAF3642596.1 putative pentatricopeptide repeat-containing protein-like [Capsicum annuum]
MRIRKHAKISPPLYTCAVFPGAHLCQLNQSPWDVITFHDDNNQEDNINQQTPLPPPAPPSSYQLLDGYDTCAVNETFSDSKQSITSLKLDDNGETKRLNFLDNKVADVPADSNDFEKDEKMGDGDNSVTTMCVKNDGKGWQCSREAKRGHNLCEHHFAQGKKHCSSNHSAQYSTTALVAAGVNSNTEIKQTAVAAAEITPSSRDRPHRTKKSLSSEYYYYSGFGPLWGKKRGPSTGKKNNTAPPLAGAAEIYSSHDSTTQGGQSSSPQMDNEGAEHVEDEDDDAEEVENCKLIKRARKPIKASSLKSLM